MVVSRVFQTFLWDFVLFDSTPDCHAPTPSSGNDDARLSVASHVSSDSISHCFRTKDGLAALQKNRSRLQSVTPEYALRLDASISYEFRDRNYIAYDNPINQKVVMYLFGKHGHNVAIA